MSLGTTGITTTTIATILGIAPLDDLSVGDLCVDSAINKWSRYKPVKGTYPQAEAIPANVYGLNLTSGWSYIRPSGGASYPYREGDFRQYEHTPVDAFPALHNLASEIKEDDLNPGGSPSQNVQKIRSYSNSVTYPFIITPLLLGINSYYYGIKIIFSGDTWYKTFGTVSELTADGTGGAPANMASTLVEIGGAGTGDWQPVGMPPGMGTCTFTIFVSSTDATSESNGGWAASAPSNMYNLPSEDITGGLNVANSGSFTVNPWIATDPNPTYDWDGFTEETVEWVISCDALTIWAYEIASLPSWTTIDIGHYVAEEWASLLSFPAQWDSGKIIRLTPDEPLGTPRSGGLNLQVDFVTVETIDLDQDQEHVLPVATINEIGSWTASGKSANPTLGLTSLPMSFTPNVSGNADFAIEKNGVDIPSLAFTDLIEDLTLYSHTFILPVPAEYDDVFLIEITYPAV